MQKVLTVLLIGMLTSGCANKSIDKQQDALSNVNVGKAIIKSEQVPDWYLQPPDEDSQLLIVFL